MKQEEQMKFGKFLLGLIVGAIAGGIVVSLNTPKNGDDMRKDILAKIDEVKLEYELGAQERRSELEQEVKKLRGEM